MKRNLVKIPEIEDRKNMFTYLRENCNKIIGQKKSLPTITDDLDFGYSVKEKSVEFEIQRKDNAEKLDSEGKTVKVEVVANMSGWCDSQLDVMIKDNWNKSINDLGASGQRLFYHLKNHGTNYQYTTDAVIGRDPELFTREKSIAEFNFKSDIKKAQALMMDSIVCEVYDRKCYNLYKDGQIKQHSIGLQYIKMYLCIDSEEPEDAMYKENWDKYFPQVLNKERPNGKGFFWAITESRILEVSAVLFGSNELTPTESVSEGKSTKDEPSNGTQPESQKIEIVQEFDLKAAILKTKFFNN